MKNSDDFAFSLLNDLYAAATCQQAWRRFVGRLQGAWLCEGVYLLVWADDDSARVAGEAGIAQRDTHMNRTSARAGEPGESLMVRWAAGREQLLRWESAEDSRLLQSACGLALSMPMDAGRDGEDIKDACQRLLSFLQPHLERVSRQVAETVQAEKRRGQPAEHGFGWFAEIFDTPVVHVDGSGHVLEMSSVALQALEKGGLKLKGRRLSACRMDEDAVLHEMIVRATSLAGHSAAVDETTKFSAAMQFSREQANPLGAIFAGVAGQYGCPSTALVFLFDHSLSASSRAPLLRKLFRLSPTEVRLVDALLQGQRLKPAAQALRLTENTARFHLKEIFRKVGVNCQVDLLRAVLALPGGVSFAGDSAPVGSMRHLVLSSAPAGPDVSWKDKRNDALPRGAWARTVQAGEQDRMQTIHRVHRISLRAGSMQKVGDVSTTDLLHAQRFAGLGLQLRMQ